MPRDRRYHGGGGRVDLTDLIMGIGEASAPTTENPFYGMKPGDVPFDKKVDPSALVSKPFTGFLSSRENTQAAQERLALQERTKADQIRRTQIIAEQAAEDARQYDLNLKRMGQEATAAGGGINSQILAAQQPYSTLASVGLAPTPQTPPLSLVPTMSGAEVAGLIGRGAYGQHGIQDYPGIRRNFVEDASTIGVAGPTAGAMAERGALEAGGALTAARNNPQSVIDAALAKYRTPALTADTMARELEKSKAQAYADSDVPLREGITRTSPDTWLNVTPPVKSELGAIGTDAEGQPVFGMKPATPSMMEEYVRDSTGAIHRRGVAGSVPAKPKPLPPLGLTPTFTPTDEPWLATPPSEEEIANFKQNIGKAPEVFPAPVIPRISPIDPTAATPPTPPRDPFADFYMPDLRNFMVPSIGSRRRLMPSY